MTLAANEVPDSQPFPSLSCAVSMNGQTHDACAHGSALLQSRTAVAKVSKNAEDPPPAPPALVDESVDESKLPKCAMECTRYFGGASSDSNPVCQSTRGSCSGKLKMSGKCPARYTKCKQVGEVEERDEIEFDEDLEPIFDIISVGSSFDIQKTSAPKLPPSCGTPCTKYFGGAHEDSPEVCMSPKGKCGGFLSNGKCPARYTICAPVVPPVGPPPSDY